MRLNSLLFLLFIIASRCFASTGDTSVVGKSRNGKRTGAWKYYSAEKHILKVEKYRNGSLHRTYIFNEKGQVIQRINRKGVVTKLRACGC